MPPKNSHPAIKTHYIFILWGDKFDEDVATIFTIEARRAGLCAKIVGLTGIQAAGGNGLLMTADLTLGQALPLADKAIGVIVPCSPAILQQIEDDPRVYEFFQQARANHALFVVSHSAAIERSSLKDLTPPLSQVSFYHDYHNLIEATRDIVTALYTTVVTTAQK